jgi:hypothetical protein
MSASSSIASRLQYQHHSIRELTSGLSEESLRLVVRPGKWSIFDNIAHLAAYQPVFIARLEKMEKEASPAFGRYVAEEDPLFPDYQEKTATELFANIETNRAIIRDFLHRGAETLWERTGLHPKFGRLTVSEWTEFFLLHEAHHLFTIFQLVQELRSRDPL